MYIRSFALWVLMASTMLAWGQQTELPTSTLAFVEEQIEGVREGYFTLSWNELPNAAFYQVTDDDGKLVYEGVTNTSFISGLSNGTYRYHVQALDLSGQMIMASEKPATVVVQHWDLTFALYLFSTGLIVVLVVLGVITRGAFQTARQGGAG